MDVCVFGLRPRTFGCVAMGSAFLGPDILQGLA